VAQVQCPTHGVFDYKTAACPGCANDARRRYEQLVTELGGETVPARLRTRFSEHDAAPPPISTAALAVLRAQDPVGAELVLAELQRTSDEFEERQRDQERVVADLVALSTTHGSKHRLGSQGSKYEGRLLGAADIGAKRYARMRQGFLDGGDTVCVPWIDAFAERVGQEIVVQWVETNNGVHFRVSDRDGRIADGDSVL